MAREDDDWNRIADLFEDEFESNQKLLITVSENNKTGARILDIRQWWRRKGDKEWHPSKRGMSMRLDDWATVVAVIQAWLDEYHNE